MAKSSRSRGSRSKGKQASQGKAGVSARKPARAPAKGKAGSGKGLGYKQALEGSLASRRLQKPHKGRRKAVQRGRGPKKPLWSLEDGVTKSLLQTWEACNEQMGLKYVDGYTPKSLSFPIEFGNVFHYGLQYQFNYSSPIACINAVTTQYRLWREKTLLNSKERDTLDFLCGIAQVTFPAYCKYWAVDDKAVKWIERERKFHVPYSLDMMNGGDPVVIYLNGMQDGLFRDGGAKKAQGPLGIFETKTKSRISEKEISTGLRADFQTLFYAFATWIEMGEMPSVVRYNIIRRADGNSPYRNKGMTLPAYLKKVKEDIEERPDHYFSRFKVSISKLDLENFKKLTLDPLLRKFVLWWDSVKKNPLGEGRFESPYHSRNLESLIGKYGVADMWELMVNGNSRPYRVRSEVFPELSDSFLVTQ